MVTVIVRPPVRDHTGVTHAVQGGPELFETMPGGLPGQTWCGRMFYWDDLGPGSCTMRQPHANPMTRAEGSSVDCMTCLVRECR